MLRGLLCFFFFDIFYIEVEMVCEGVKIKKNCCVMFFYNYKWIVIGFFKKKK